MKHIQLLITTLFFCFVAIAQSPQKMSYQMVVRNSSNVLVINQIVGVKISLLQASATGTAVFVETHLPTTNANGLASLVIGDGTIVTGSFAAVDWANGPYFIKSETDPTGGTNYTITGTSQLMSVPYALFAGSTLNLGKTYLVISGDMTNAEASAKVASDAGPNTQFVWVQNCNQLTTLNLAGFINSVEIIVSGNKRLKTINLPDLKSLSSRVSITNNDSLTTISCPELSSVANDISIITNNFNLAAISFPKLLSANTIQVQFNAASSSISIPLMTTGKDISISNATSISMPLLATATNLGISNFYGTSVLFPQLLTVNGNLSFTSPGAAGSSCSFPLLNNISGDLTCYYTITSISFPQLNTVNGTISISSTVPTLALPSLSTVGILSVMGNGSLTSISLPQLTAIKGDCKINTNPNLTSLSFPLITAFGTSNSSVSNINLDANKLPTTVVNALLNKFVNITPLLSSKTIKLSQSPSAPPTGQGITDKATLIARPNTVTTN